MNRILLITEKESDLGNLLQKTCKDVTVIGLDKHCFDLDMFDSLCILGGNTDRGVVLNAPLRMCVEKFIAQGKPVFTEYVRSIAQTYVDISIHTSHHRMVFSDKTYPMPGLSSGDVLDTHVNDCLQYGFAPQSAFPIFTCHGHICAHSHIEMTDEEFKNGATAMWKDGNLMVCGFRLCNWRRARLAPRRSFEALVTAVIRFVAGEDVKVEFEAPVCTYEPARVSNASDTKNSVKRALDWFSNADMLVDGGKYGVWEGFSHLISAKDGIQERRMSLRADCTGEVAGAFMLQGLLTGDEKLRTMGEEMFDFVFNYLQVKEGEHKGMVRWTSGAWCVCYADDVARAMLGLLLRQYFDGEVPHFNEICDALDYLADTTGPEGIRIPSTNIATINKAELAKPGAAGRPSAHRDAYYHATLLLAYRICKNERYLDIAERGLGYMMSVYPDTFRETSETEENCRLLFALAVLYEITKKKEHYDWLCRVADYLDEHRHACGAVPEWDTGYKAKCSRNHKGECALLANNGDPIVDLLYSNNWLPLGYAYAYMATGEERFYKAWCDVASFLLSCQIHSKDKLLDGAWTRAFDIENWEIHGVPHDIGWAPCCMETGWTVGEIIMGFQFMEQTEKMKK